MVNCRISVLFALVFALATQTYSKCVDEEELRILMQEMGVGQSILNRPVITRSMPPPPPVDNMDNMDKVDGRTRMDNEMVNMRDMRRVSMMDDHNKMPPINILKSLLDNRRMSMQSRPNMRVRSMPMDTEARQLRFLKELRNRRNQMQRPKMRSLPMPVDRTQDRLDWAKAEKEKIERMRRLEMQQPAMVRSMQMDDSMEDPMEDMILRREIEELMRMKGPSMMRSLRLENMDTNDIYRTFGIRRSDMTVPPMRSSNMMNQMNNRDNLMK